MASALHLYASMKSGCIYERIMTSIPNLSVITSSVELLLNYGPVPGITIGWNPLGICVLLPSLSFAGPLSLDDLFLESSKNRCFHKN